ncbi:toxic anion resistance protein [Vibrio campbellii]|uniref:Toxic anion resistance protein n=1 Tax=Vibrio campbellii TaxID=680 RepID=A0ABY5IE07_9VIBR|nr:toxic anion resistance protein [Vibrio campbellii]UTZ21479.1 toxic anion resistance protein [Vibrio campbellii]UTZ31141.1 toxic anion resistance protein [Vibrio campbellii]
MAFKPKTFAPKTINASETIQSATANTEVMPVATPHNHTPVVAQTASVGEYLIPNLSNRVQTIVDDYKRDLSEANMNPQEVFDRVVSQLNQVDIYSSRGIANLGQESAEKISQYSDSMLSQVRTKDLEEMGENLNQVVGLAKGVDLSGLIGKDSFFGKIISKFRQTKESILAQFNSVSTQLDRVIKEIDTQQSRLQERSGQLDAVFSQNIAQYKALTEAIIYGESRRLLLQDKIESLSNELSSEHSPLKAQELSDLQACENRIEKRVHDLKSLQMLALQTAPMIRMVQNNNITLVEKFNNIKTLTIPSWKKQFTLAISMLEQKKSLELATKIDDATNDLIRKNADLLRQNTLQTAQANQRSVVDIETLEHVQNTLISTLQDVVSIEQEGARTRKAADEKMVQMKSELSNFLKKNKE